MHSEVSFCRDLILGWTMNQGSAPSWWELFIFLILFTLLFWGIRHFELDRRQKQQQIMLDKARADEQGRRQKKIKEMEHALNLAHRQLSEKETEVDRLQQALLKQDQLAMLGQLTAGLAHEIKNPLNFVTNFSEISLEQLDEVATLLKKYEGEMTDRDRSVLEEILTDLRQNALDIHESGLRAVTTIHSMMDHTRERSDQIRPADINALLDENARLVYLGFRSTHPKFQLRMIKEYDPALPEIALAPHALGRVLINILNNGCYALYQKQLAIGHDYVPTFRLSTHAQNGKVDISIRDNGPGIPREVREEIFKPFFTTKPPGTGNTGLGLAISREIIVEQHKGELVVDSEPGQYTEFRISLPMRGE